MSGDVDHSQTIDSSHQMVVVWTRDGDTRREHIWRSDRPDTQDLQVNTYVDGEFEETDVLSVDDLDPEVRDEINELRSSDSA